MEKRQLKYTKEETKTKDFVSKRITEMQDARKNVLGVNLESIWRQADRDYIPHKLGKVGKKVLVQDEDLGLASRRVEVGKDDWQTDNSIPNAYIKIQTALSIMVSKNPSAVFTPRKSKYESNTLVQKELYKMSWEEAKSLQQLKLFIFNLAKYGWAIARTYPLILKRPTRVLTEYNEDDPSKNVYQNKMSTEYNGVFRENLDPWKSWIDDMSKPNNPLSTKDWCYAKEYNYATLKEEFGNYPNFKYISEGKSELIGDSQGKETTQEYETKDVKIPYFYENRIKDMLVVMVDKVMLVNEPLPISDPEGNKKLSLWHTYWTTRHAECPYGIGINEAIKQDQTYLDRINNMTADQLILSIYKMFFYEGTDQLDESGAIKIRPGVGKQVSNSKGVNWMEVPGPGAEAWKGIEITQDRIDEASAITKQLTTGEQLEKTAYQAAQRAEFSLRRLNTPLSNITDALETDAYLTLSINELIYSIPEVITITDERLIKQYLQETGSDPELYQRGENGEFQAKLYPEVQLGLEEEPEGGRLVESENSKFFRMKPAFLKWEGMIRVKGQSLLAESKSLLKQMKLELFNMINPLFGVDQTGQMYLPIVKWLCKIYEEDWQDLVPEAWKQPAPQEQKGLFVPQDGTGDGGGGVPIGGGQKVDTRMGRNSLVSKAMSGASKLFSGFKK
uniref:Portal protein n=1 Tax=viral metagenome TaxID=1070528 RepID=A0A6H1ZG58_9ZZZZ